MNGFLAPVNHTVLEAEALDAGMACVDVTTEIVPVILNFRVEDIRDQCWDGLSVKINGAEYVIPAYIRTSLHIDEYAVTTLHHQLRQVGETCHWFTSQLHRDVLRGMQHARAHFLY